jgi:N-acetylated-alpha-linked acidic dipeptidase
MRRLLGLIVVSLGVLALPALTQERQSTLDGFTTESARAEQQWEEKFRAMPLPNNMRDAMQHLSAHPHHVGSPYDQENATWLRDKFISYGWDAKIETFKVLFPTPKERLVEMTAPTRFTAKLQEPALPQDPTSNQQAEQLPTYNAYSIDGDVTGPLVYVNYGVPADYEELDRHGISVKGAIVIARYGGSWRGIKPKVAAEHGAVGCLIYSDPKDDGYGEGTVFPEGPWRSKDGVQRGSVADMPLYPGDPLTPGIGATEDAKRLPIKDAPTITKIPVLPISYGDAQPLLAAMTGPMAPYAWRGGLPISYRLGPGASQVHLVVKSNWDLKPVNDVIAKIPGSSEADQWIIRGNHHDGWVNGAQDPISGLVTELEEARALGELVKQGWKPKRTIIYCAWDGEEPGLLGSTEWAETHAEELKQHAVIYFNSDTNSRGFIGMEGSHALEPFLNDVARSITDPEKNMPVWKRTQMARIANADSTKEKEEIRAEQNMPIGAMGSGSDFTVFLDFLGVSTAAMAYGGEAGGGIYHSIYDDFYWFTHFDDPGFLYGKAESQTMGTAVMRMADADLLPYDFTTLASTVKKYEGELESLAQGKREDVREQNREIEDGTLTNASDPTETYVPPKHEELPPYVNFAPLKNSVDALTRAAERYSHAHSQAMQNGGAALAHASLAGVNQKLYMCERSLTSDKGLPGRPWFKHQLYAPGFYTGYGVKTIPAVREAIEQKNWQLTEEQIGIVATVLMKEAAAIDAASSALEGAAH